MIYGNTGLKTSDVIQAVVYGGLKVIDKGEQDYKLIFIVQSPQKSIDELFTNMIRALQNAAELNNPKHKEMEEPLATMIDFFKSYKQNPDEVTFQQGDIWMGPEEATKFLQESHDVWKKRLALL